ncbi:MAG TPA: peptidyl-prolyl cis-trans isomerase [Acidimicrobiia bacterium]|nr:peptidyl-prolyl cis-trans isomerase [Acidimicrobiia bacterium]
MTDEPEVPPETGAPEPGPPDAAASQEDLGIEALADEIAKEEAEEAEGSGPAEWDGSETKTPGAAEPGPSKLAMVAVALVALLAGAGTAYALSHRGGGCPPKGSALKVEGTTVSTTELQRRIELLRALYDVRPPTDAAQLAAFKGDAAKGTAVAVLVAHDVVKRNLQVADKTVRDGLDRFISQRYPQGGRTQFIQALGTFGVSEDDVLGEFRRLLETRALFQAVTADAKVTEDQITKAFGERKDQLAVPERRHLRHLVVKTEDEANKALTRIKGPETFEVVATAVSLDASTKDQAGDLGTVSQAQLDPAFGAAAFAAAKGSTFGPVMTKNGWHVGLVEDITAGHPVTLAEVHDSLRDTLVGEIRLAQWRTYLAGRISHASACYAKGNRPADPKAAPPDITPSTLTR